MENLENQDLIPEIDPTLNLQPETPPAEPFAPETNPVSLDATSDITDAEPAVLEAEFVQETIADETPEEPTSPPKYEWDCGMVFPPPKKEKKHAKKSCCGLWKRLLACVLVVALVATGCLVTGTVLNNYWAGENQKLRQQLSSLTGKLDRLQLQIQTNN